MNMKDMLRDKSQGAAALRSVLYWFCAVVYWEWLLHIVALGEVRSQFGYVLGFSFVFGAALALVTTFLKEKLRFVADTVLTVVMVLLYGSQMVYDFIFGSLYAVAQMQLGGDALTSFWKETLLAMCDGILYLLLLFVPIVVMAFFKKLRDLAFEKTGFKCWVVLIVLGVAIQLLTIQSLKIGGTGFFTNFYFYNSNETTTDQAAERFGLLTAMRLELFAEEEPEVPAIQEPVDVMIGEAEVEPETEPLAEPEEEGIAYNILDIDFEELNQLTDDARIRALNDYCATLTGTNKNEYTGMLADYNLIVLCAESFDTGALHPEVTPTLYRMAQEGIVFNNYYNTFPNTTTDGEYALCMGLYPDGTRNKENASFKASIGNNLVYALGNLFKNQKGIQSYGYHNYVGSYYNRNETHPNMGYEMKFAKDGMNFTTDWPASDLEMMEQSIDDYIGQDQFHAYYMTFSGHFRYDTVSNLIAKRNWMVVNDLEYNFAPRAYLSCHVELEKAIAYLMERLEEEGIADKTAIVLASDHFPYGLSDGQYSELVGYRIDQFTKYKSTLIFWVGGLEENIVVDQYCCNVDILPTILNLWGFEYDSRLLAGTDVFSDGYHMAVLKDSSFYNDKVWLNASSGEVRYLLEENELPRGYVENMVAFVKKKMNMSVDILNTDYYNFVYSNYQRSVG